MPRMRSINEVKGITQATGSRKSGRRSTGKKAPGHELCGEDDQGEEEVEVLRLLHFAGHQERHGSEVDSSHQGESQDGGSPDQGHAAQKDQGNNHGYHVDEAAGGSPADLSQAELF